MVGDKLGKQNKKQSVNLRYNIITVLIYVVGIILIMQLFNLQIVHGQEYRNESDTRLSRESKLEAARGSIVDKTGNILATSKMGFSIELYKTKIDNDTLNNTLLELVKILEENKQTYADSLPITVNPYKFTIDGETLKKWKENNDMEEDDNAEACFNKLKEKYEIKNDNIDEARKIMTLRYEISQKGYSNTRSVNIAEDISREVVAQLSERNNDFPGITIVTEPIRTYTSGSLASHILGYIGKIDEEEYQEKKEQYDADDDIGKIGTEYVFEEYLKGKDGVRQLDMAVDGTVTSETVTEEAVAGSDIVLTIDANLQKVTEDALENNIKKIASGGFSERYNAKAGSAVVMNVKTGEILAMANYPDFEPELFVGGISTENWAKYRDDSAKPLTNKAVQDAYAPGSIFKMVTAIAGLESNTVTTKTRIRDTGVYPKYTHPVCWYWTDYHRGHGYLNVTGAIQHSCNYYFYKVSDDMGIDTLVKYAKYFGLGSKTGIELPSETAGNLASKETKAELTNGEQWYPGETLSAAIGQSYNSFSPLQMTKYISMLANGGKQVNPTIIKTIRNPDGTEVSKEEINTFVHTKLGLQEEQTEDLEIKQKNLDAILEGMRSVTSETGGTAYSIFKNFDIEVGGKTGSAEAGPNVNAWFAGFAPFDDPEIAIVVMVENGGHGNYTAEVVRDIMKEYFGMNAEEIQENMEAKPYTESMR